MNRFNLYVVSFLVAQFGGAAMAQVNLYPAHYARIQESHRLYNPACVNLFKKAGLELGNQLYSGIYNKVENHYFLATIRLNSDSLRNSHQLGAKLITEKEGEFISRPRFYLTYAWHTRLSDTYFVGAGIAAGFAAYVYKATNVSGGGSATVPDADFGLSLYSRSFKMGVSINQLVNLTLVPRELVFSYRRFYTLYAEKKWHLKEGLSVSLFAQKQFRNEEDDLHDIGTSLLFQEKFEIGISDFIDQKLSFMAGFKNIAVSNKTFDLLFGYSIPVSQKSLNATQMYEIMVAYHAF